MFNVATGEECAIGDWSSGHNVWNDEIVAAERKSKCEESFGSGLQNFEKVIRWDILSNEGVESILYLCVVSFSPPHPLSLWAGNGRFYKVYLWFFSFIYLGSNLSFIIIYVPIHHLRIYTLYTSLTPYLKLQYITTILDGRV